MATLTQDNNSSRYQIRGYQPGWLKINETVFTESIIITPDQLFDHWPPQSANELTAKDFSSVILLKPAILLIGTGSEFKLLDIKIYGDLINHGIGVEIMNTSAACRTFNVLSSENRHVVAALLLK